MEQNTSQFSELINMIKASTMEESFKGIAIRNFRNQFVYGEIMHGLIIKPFQLKVTDKDNFCQNLYDKVISVQFLDFIRPEMKFPSLDVLKSQMNSDIAQAQNYYKSGLHF